jgi:hypothetical protein
MPAWNNKIGVPISPAHNFSANKNSWSPIDNNKYYAAVNNSKKKMHTKNYHILTNNAVLPSDVPIDVIHHDLTTKSPNRRPGLEPTLK